MKRLAICILSLTMLAACGAKKGGKELAQEICDCSKKANALPTTDPNRSKAQSDCSLKQGEAWAKIKDKTEDAEAFNKVLSECASQQIKESFGK
jgi:hypothetical protein